MLSQNRCVADEAHTVVRMTFPLVISTVPHLTRPLMGGGPPQHAFMDVNPEEEKAAQRHPTGRQRNEA